MNDTERNQCPSNKFSHLNLGTFTLLNPFNSTRQTKIDIVTKSVFFAIAAIFLIVQFNVAVNAPFAPDDARMFLSQFMNKYVDATFIEKIKYHFSVTNYPHAKFSGRAFSTLFYEITGSVDFKFLIMLGSAILVFFITLTKRALSVNYLILIPLALLLLTPSRVNHWVGPIAGYPFLLVYTLLTFYLISKGKFLLPILIACICSFTHSPGIGIFLAAFPLFLIEPNKSWQKRTGWVAAFMSTAFIYWATIISKAPLVRSENGRGIFEIAQCLPSLIAYEGQFLALPFFGQRQFGQFLKSTPILAIIMALSVLGVCLFVIWTRRKSFDPKFAFLLSFLVFCLIPGPISAFVSDKCTTMNDLVAPRYMMYSLMAWTGIYVFLIGSVKPRFQILLAIIFSALFLPRFHANYKEASYFSNYLSYKWVKRGTLNKVNKLEKVQTNSVFIKAIEKSVFKPRHPAHPQLTGDIGAIEANWSDFWYQLDINEYYCKVEILSRNEENAPVEIWVGDENGASGLQRYTPTENNPRATLSTFFPNRKKAPKKLRHPSIRAYYYVAENSGQCESSLRFRQGENLSPVLVKNDE